MRDDCYSSEYLDVDMFIWILEHWNLIQMWTGEQHKDEMKDELGIKTNGT